MWQELDVGVPNTGAGTVAEPAVSTVHVKESPWENYRAKVFLESFVSLLGESALVVAVDICSGT